MRMTRGWRTVSVAVLVPGLLAFAGCTRFGASLARPEDPVVFDGSSLPLLIGATIPSIVGYSWDGNAWHQIPVQVDERDLVNPGKILHWPTASWPKNANGTNFTILAYTDPSASSPGYTSWATYTG